MTRCLGFDEIDEVEVDGEFEVNGEVDYELDLDGEFEVEGEVDCELYLDNEFDVDGVVDSQLGLDGDFEGLGREPKSSSISFKESSFLDFFCDFSD
ncbi:unnamed protein product [Brachionus calyciflorus]|uniref:Uncharacterized protein n=1 Tax=Brachionus calyciflorus TaxID=104777 RepID=A0A814MRM3_9BILA|nr:unnamed protein product [Brachionus calyciflorus]